MYHILGDHMRGFLDASSTMFDYKLLYHNSDEFFQILVSEISIMCSTCFSPKDLTLILCYHDISS